MEHTGTTPGTGRMRPGMAAAAALGAVAACKGKVKGAAETLSSSPGRGSGWAAAPFSAGRGSGSAAAPFYVGRGSGSAAPVFPIGGGGGVQSTSPASGVTAVPSSPLDVADKFYEDHKLGPFVIKNVWKICRKVAKWITYNEELKNARKRKSYRLEEEDVQNVESEDEMLKRPPGQKAAKKATLAAKGKTKAMGDDGKSKESAINVEKLDKWSKMQEESNANRLMVLELQQKLSSYKIETTKLAHLTAQENTESRKLEIEGRKLEMEGRKLEMESKKLEKESKMMDAYNSLISQDTSSMTNEEKVERVAAMKCLRKMLFPKVI